jgi:hypothetical protein
LMDDSARGEAASGHQAASGLIAEYS